MAGPPRSTPQQFGMTLAQAKEVIRRAYLQYPHLAPGGIPIQGPSALERLGTGAALMTGAGPGVQAAQQWNAEAARSQAEQLINAQTDDAAVISLASWIMIQAKPQERRVLNNALAASYDRDEERVKEEQRAEDIRLGVASTTGYQPPEVGQELIPDTDPTTQRKLSEIIAGMDWNDVDELTLALGELADMRNDEGLDRIAWDGIFEQVREALRDANKAESGALGGLTGAQASLTIGRERLAQEAEQFGLTREDALAQEAQEIREKLEDLRLKEESQGVTRASEQGRLARGSIPPGFQFTSKTLRGTEGATTPVSLPDLPPPDPQALEQRVRGLVDTLSNGGR